MNDLRQWMDARMDALAEELAEINSEEVLQRGVGGFGMQQRAIALLTTIKAALFPSIYENGAVTDKHLTTLGQERLFASAEQLLGIARAAADRRGRPLYRSGREVLDRLTPARIEALAKEWNDRRKEDAPGLDLGRRRLDALKKAWSTRRGSAFAGACSGPLGRCRRRTGPGK